MTFIPIETEEFAPGEIIGDYKLFDHCTSDVTPPHKYILQIGLTVDWIAIMATAFSLNPKNIALLSEYNAVVAHAFIKMAFIDNYEYDSRTDFLNYQFGSTRYKKQFLIRVRNLLTVKSNFFVNDNSSYIKDQEVLRWLDNKELQMSKGSIKLRLSHHLHALIYYYRAEAGDIPKVFPRKQIIEEYGKARERAIAEIWNPKYLDKNRPTLEELTEILPWLKSSDSQKAYVYVSYLIEKLNADRYPTKPK